MTTWPIVDTSCTSLGYHCHFHLLPQASNQLGAPQPISLSMLMTWPLHPNTVHPSYMLSPSSKSTSNCATWDLLQASSVYDLLVISQLRSSGLISVHMQLMSFPIFLCSTPKLSQHQWTPISDLARVNPPSLWKRRRKYRPSHIFRQLEHYYILHSVPSLILLIWWEFYANSIPILALHTRKQSNIYCDMFVEHWIIVSNTLPLLPPHPLSFFSPSLMQTMVEILIMGAQLLEHFWRGCQLGIPALIHYCTFDHWGRICGSKWDRTWALLAT